MIQLPASTLLAQAKSLYQPYQRGNSDFFAKAGFGKKDEQLLRQEIAQISITHQINTKTTNVPEGKQVKSLLVLRVTLTGTSVFYQLLEELDLRMKMYLIFVLVYPDGTEELLVHYKEALASPKEGRHYKSLRRFTTTKDWQLDLAGQDLDVVYEHLVKQTADEPLLTSQQSLSEGLQLVEQLQKLEKKAEQVKKKMYAQKVLSKQLALRKDYQKLQEEITQLKLGNQQT